MPSGIKIVRPAKYSSENSSVSLYRKLQLLNNIAADNSGLPVCLTEQFMHHGLRYGRSKALERIKRYNYDAASAMDIFSPITRL